ncbi:MAG: DUF533 domain-containing protein [Candidatus Eremiobacterota bacterium]
MQDKEKALVRSLVRIIWADGEIAAEEREFLGAVLAQLGASPDEVLEVGKMLQEPPDLDDLREKVPDQESRREIMRVLLAMALADGRVDLGELRFLNKMAAILEISDKEMESLKEETLKVLEAES